MVNICFLPSDASRCCLDLSSLLSSLEPWFTSNSSLHLQRSVDEKTDALFWLPSISQGDTSAELGRILCDQGNNIRFVQLPMTGVDHFLTLIRQTQDRIRWSCAKGCYAEAVAEHAVALVLTLMRALHIKPPRSAGEMDTLFRKKVLIVGAGFISSAIQRLLLPFDCTINKLDSTSPTSLLLTNVVQAQVIILACSLTPTTCGLFNDQVFANIRSDAILVNIARGELIVTSTLVTALKNNTLKAAGLDVINLTTCTQQEQEQLQQFVQHGKLLISPHSAVPASLIGTLLGQRIRDNLERLAKNGLDGEQGWVGLVDANKGY